MTTSPNPPPGIRRRVIKPYERSWATDNLEGIKITYSDLIEIESILSSYVAKSPAPPEYRPDDRKLEITALTAVLDSVSAVSLLNRDELKKLEIEATTNDSIHGVSVKFGSGGNVSVSYDRKNDNAVETASLLKTFLLRNRPSRLTARRLLNVQLMLGVVLPVVLVVLYFVLTFVLSVSVWKTIWISAVSVVVALINRSFSKRFEAPTVNLKRKNGSEHSGSFTAANLTALAVSVVGVVVAVIALVTR